jgi:hypothetical protein
MYRCERALHLRRARSGRPLPESSIHPTVGGQKVKGQRKNVERWRALFLLLPFAFAFCLDYDATVNKALIPCEPDKR